ncbi:MAG TPA: cation diffusion facilitator family transporter, partial [Thermodesulfobacteriota bacterium]|nr:cation diffusion facilitator family transporter [Thermodesulfobacteriota bacterium]
MEKIERDSEKNCHPSRIASYSTILNVLVTLAKGVLAWLSGSSALLADAIHGFSDTFASLLVLVGIWLSKKKSETFPWGLYKVENFVALASAGLIFFAGYEIIRHVFEGERAFVLGHFYSSLFGLLAIILAIAIFSRFEARKARNFRSPSLLADASHWYSDIASTTLVLLAVLGSRLGYPILDRLAALIMVGFIAKAGWNILKDSMRTLLDASVDARTLNRLRDEILRFSEVKEIKSLQARNSGRFVFVRTELVFGIKKFSQAHQLSEKIEKAILKSISCVDKVTIHYEPLEKHFLIYAIPVDEDRHNLSEHLGGAPYFYLIRMSTEGHMIQEEKILPNPYLNEEKGKGIKVSEWLLQNGVDAVLTRKAFEGKGPFYVLSSSEV